MRIRILLSLGLLLPVLVQAQPGFDPFFGTQPENKSSGWRKIANMFTFEGSVGHGATFYSHDVSQIPLVMTADSVLILGAQADTGVVASVSGLGNWLNEASGLDTTAIFPFAYRGDSVLGFRTLNHSLAFNARVYFSIDRFRLGAGVQYEWQWFRPMNPTSFQDKLGPYRPRVEMTTLERYYALAGARFYRYRKLSYVAEVEVGLIKMGTGFETVTPIRRVYLNIGVPIEYNFSEYLRVYLRPSFEFKSYDLDLGSYSNLTHNQNAFYTQFGISFTPPEIRRCPVDACHIAVKHRHQGHLFRGSPINKIQNPDYGENHPVLEKHKWRLFQKREGASAPRKWQFWRKH